MYPPTPGTMGRSLLVAVLTLGSCFASVTDTSVYAPANYTAMTPPAKGGTYADSEFGTIIKRVSDAVNTPNADAGGMLQFITTEYPTNSPFNQTNTRLLLIHQSYFGLYDGSGNFIQNLPMEVNSSSEPRWSRKNPNVFYYHVGNQLRSYDTSTGAISPVHTFSEYGSITGNGEMDISQDGDHLVFAGDRRYVFVYEISTDTKGPALDTAGNAFDSIYITPNNNVSITWNAVGTGRYNGVELFDRNMNFQRQLARTGGHMRYTRDTNGEEVLVWCNSNDPTPVAPNAIVKIRLSDGTQTPLVSLDWSLAVHVTAPDNSGYAFVETYAPSDPVSGTSAWKTYTNELLQVKLDGTEVRRLAHHRSRPFNSYNYQPKMAVSRDGTKLVYDSNFSLQALSGYPTEYCDVYMIDLAGTGGGSTTSSGPQYYNAQGNPYNGESTAYWYCPADGKWYSGDKATGQVTAVGPTPPWSSGGTAGPQPPVSGGSPWRIEQNNPSLRFSGAWYVFNDSVFSGGSAAYATDPQSSVSLTFNGTGVSWIAFKDAWSGIALVTLDGVPQVNVDLYSASTQNQVTLYGVSRLAPGQHTITVQATGTHNPASTQSWIWIDAFDVQP